MRKFVFLAPLVVAGLAAAVIFGVRNWPSDGLNPTTVLARSQAAEEEVLAQLTEGKVLYLRDEAYARQGPAASAVREICSEWCLPERYVHELWLEVGRGGKITRVRGWVKSETGQLLQDITTVGSEVITQEVASAAEFRTPLRLSVEDIASSMRMSADFRAQQLSTGAATISGRSLIGERATIILDESIPLPPASDNVGDGYSIPYVQDIKPVSLLRRIEVDSASFLPMRWSVIAVDRQGKEHVIETKTREAFEVVDRSEVPGTP